MRPAGTFFIIQLSNSQLCYNIIVSWIKRYLPLLDNKGGDINEFIKGNASRKATGIFFALIHANTIRPKFFQNLF